MFIFFHANESLLTQIPLQYIIYHYWYYRIIRFDGDSISKHFKGNGTLTHVTLLIPSLILESMKICPQKFKKIAIN